MAPRFAAFFLSITAYFGAQATAQLITSTTSAPPEPQHTAIYTITLGNFEAITTVIVTLLMPRHHTGFPKDGTPVTGTAISQLSAVQPGGGMSTWSETAELYWTLTGNSDPRWPNTKRPRLSLDTTTVLQSSYIENSFSTTDYYDSQGIHMRYVYTRLQEVELAEGVGPKYPATIVRQGKTLRGAGGSGGIVGEEPHSWMTAERFFTFTTMVQVSARPTP